jgi:hypothetical protein
MRTRMLTIALVTVALICFGGSAAHASTPVSGSGTFHFTLAPVGSRTADGNTFIAFTFHETITGLYSGKRVGTGSLTVHPDGTVTASDSGVFTGTIAGSSSGSAVLSVDAVGTLSALTANLEATDGVGGLAGVHGQAIATGAATGPTTFAGTYAGRAQFGSP